MEFMYERYTPSCSSSWSRPYGDSTILLKSVKQLFQVTEKLIKDQTEISGLNTIEYKEPTWRSTTLLCDKAIGITNAQTCVFADSVLCLGSMSDQPVEAWKNKIKWYLGKSPSQRSEADRVPVEHIPRIHFIGNARRDSKIMTQLQCEPEQFKGRTIFMSMYNDIDWGKRGNRENCIANAHRVAEYARRFTRRHWSFLEHVSEKKCYSIHVSKLDGDWDKTAEDMVLNFVESRHTTFSATSALERGELKSKGKEVKSIHINGCDDIIELIFRTIISVNQPSVYGAVADPCGKLAKDSRDTGTPHYSD